ncbi:PTS lactose/cellobiose transporter subunit IIA [Vibrio sp. TH_r3]|uniref:PTS lactose/cellobiose transporter subunit IIA n=1 Tax=Vibrio sp. TH_r3 TaxID=3082084 RepID=UPI002952B215|nr:PTS lactose/cellobiose transporter subunit IIA [Vibrio sp. TH_r3]MDV7105089.1 PTS lactose/cellobiose transporter subunit IIA [Vibrio sp. TH_r3]
MTEQFDIKSAEDISEEFLMMLLTQAAMGESASKEAMQKARIGEFEQAKQLIVQADQAFSEVHKTQTSLIGFDEGEGKVPMTLILTHIQDHIMTGMLAKELAEEVILIREEIRELKEKFLKV